MILRGLSQKDNRIKIISQSNSGSFMARKAGILSATGDYIMFVDADDKLSNKNAASIIVERFNEKSVELLQFGFYSYQGRFIRKKHINQVLGLITKEDLKNLYYKDYLSSESSGALGVSLWNKAYLTHILKESVSNLDTKIKFGEDLLLLLKYISNSKFLSMYNISNCLYSYYSGIGICSKNDENVLDEYSELKKAQLKLCKDWSLCEDAKYYCNLESIYLLFLIVKDMISNGKDRNLVLSYIKKSNEFECIKIAKCFYRNDYSKELYEELRFLVSNYTPEQYYKYAENHIHKMNFMEKIFSKVKSLL